MAERCALRLAAAAAVLLGLSGCNNVVSNEPWFTAADAEGAPVLRDGLWAMVTEDDCRVNFEKPAERWPDCVDPFYVRGREWLAIEWDDGNGTKRRKRVFAGWESAPIILAAGDPAILQIDEGSKPPASPSEADPTTADGDEPHWRYSYAGMLPTEFDADGRVLEFEFWSVQCGPLPSREIRGAVEYPLLETLEGNYVTERPYPGLTVVGQKCTAESVDALRRAAVSSRAMSQPSPIRWVRDGWR